MIWNFKKNQKKSWWFFLTYPFIGVQADFLADGIVDAGEKMHDNEVLKELGKKENVESNT